MKHFCLVLAILALSACCHKVLDSGVSVELATDRVALLSDITYSLDFDLTSDTGHIISYDTIRFHASTRQDIILDFKAPSENIRSIEINYYCPIKVKKIENRLPQCQ